MSRFVKCSILWASLSVAGWGQTGSTPSHLKIVGIVPPKGSPALNSSNPATSATAPSGPYNVPFNGIQYQGGPVMNDPRGVNAYYIWYGNWSGSEVPPILTDFIEHIGGTAYWNINTSYYDFTADGAKDPIKNRVNFGGSAFDEYSH
jgi:hypothetical protein